MHLFCNTLIHFLQILYTGRRPLTDNQQDGEQPDRHSDLPSPKDRTTVVHSTDPQPRTRGLASTSTTRSSPSIMISNHRTHKSISHLLTTVLYISRARYIDALLLGCNLLRLIQLPWRLRFLSIGLLHFDQKRRADAWCHGTGVKGESIFHPVRITQN